MANVNAMAKRHPLSALSSMAASISVANGSMYLGESVALAIAS